MTSTLILESNQKVIRRLSYLWTSLVNPKHYVKNYVIPETIDEFKQIGGIFASKITIDSMDWYFSQKSETILRDFVSTLYKIKEIGNAVSFDFAYKMTISFIEASVNAQLKHTQKPVHEKEVKKILRALMLEQTIHQFYRVVDGIELKDMNSIIFGDVELFNFSKKNILEIKKFRQYNNLNGFYDKSVEPFIKKHFLDKTCIRTIGKGDETKANEIAMKKIREVISILRFIVCILAHEKIYQNTVKINLLAESYNTSESTFRININNKGIALNYGASRKPLRKLPLNSEMMTNLKEYYFFDDWHSILSKQTKTKLEEAILTAIYWIGEAQNDFIYESSFIKFWTALEALFSIREEYDTKPIICPNCQTQMETIKHEEGITKSLSKGVATMLAFGGYRFIEINDVKKIFKDVTKLYKKRSAIIHRGSYGKVTPIELSEICKYATWCVLTCFGLRTQGYETLEQIRKEAIRLYNLSEKYEGG